MPAADATALAAAPAAVVVQDASAAGSLAQRLSKRTGQVRKLWSGSLRTMLIVSVCVWRLCLMRRPKPRVPFVDHVDAYP